MDVDRPEEEQYRSSSEGEEVGEVAPVPTELPSTAHKSVKKAPAKKAKAAKKVVQTAPKEHEAALVDVSTAGGPDRPREEVDLTPRDTHIEIDLKIGDATATILTNDLTHDYVHENSAYAS